MQGRVYTSDKQDKVTQALYMADRDHGRQVEAILTNCEQIKIHPAHIDFGISLCPYG